VLAVVLAVGAVSWQPRRRTDLDISLLCIPLLAPQHCSNAWPNLLPPTGARSHPLPACSTLFGLALSNLGVVPAEAPHVYGVVNNYFLPLAVPLLLFSADLRY